MRNFWSQQWSVFFPSQWKVHLLTCWCPFLCSSFEVLLLVEIQPSSEKGCDIIGELSEGATLDCWLKTSAHVCLCNDAVTHCGWFEFELNVFYFFLVNRMRSFIIHNRCSIMISDFYIMSSQFLTCLQGLKSARWMEDLFCVGISFFSFEVVILMLECVEGCWGYLEVRVCIYGGIF